EKAIACDNTSGFNQLIVPPGKRTVLNLPDGTKVWVNSDTRLIYPASFSHDMREIFVNGEIYIDVAKDEKRPFIVKTKDMEVRVLGTKFNITAYEEDDEKTVVLVSGSVQINTKNNNDSALLTPEQMYVNEKGQTHITTVDTKTYTSWIDGIYFCKNLNLENILQRLSRYYGVEIACDPSVGKEIFSGKLDLKENLDSIFDGIAFAIPISYTESNGAYLITPKK
ncbi:MAG: FecR family protein, partial [Prevotella sp.]|nr:FecR family protein [Prevotella sp.]